MSARYSINDIALIRGREVFFDANVLIYLYWTSNPHWENKYAAIFSVLMRNKIDKVIDFTVISEFTNRTIRLQYDKYLSANGLKKDNYTFKDYRDSEEGIEAIEDIYKILNETILPMFEIIPRGFSKQDIEDFLNIESLDLSDKAILLICKEKDYVLLTNDKDFCNSEVDILTANKTFF